MGSTDGNSNAGLQEAMGEQNLYSLQNQVSTLQERLDNLQVTMLGVMDKYGNLRKLEELHLKNLSMGSLLILLPFCPSLRKLTLKYSLRGDEAAPISPILSSSRSSRRTNSLSWRLWRSGARLSASGQRSGSSGTVTISGFSSLSHSGT